jgi:hypothetical protein
MFLALSRTRLGQVWIGALDPDWTKMCPPLDEIAVERLATQDTWKRYAWRSIMKRPRDDDISVLAVYPACK